MEEATIFVLLVVALQVHRIFTAEIDVISDSRVLTVGDTLDPAPSEFTWSVDTRGFPQNLSKQGTSVKFWGDHGMVRGLVELVGSNRRCACLDETRFLPRNQQGWQKEEWMGGCVRRLNTIGLRKWNGWVYQILLQLSLYYDLVNSETKEFIKRYEGTITDVDHVLDEHGERPSNKIRRGGPLLETQCFYCLKYGHTMKLFKSNKMKVVTTQIIHNSNA
ncbi:hypothetical protein L2E82_24813 [Cichorium intybus]|uniref:Uncharacterized protein n=1 Tax=Cichorium intybus TaxID=13427 RepID=A0ACB9E1Y4_CICIN|nr:hypothetical protein L2E82_24813 [Cichorium intybus]